MTGVTNGSAPGRVVDLLTSQWGEWFTVDHLVAELLDRWPDMTDKTVRRAVFRLAKRGHPELLFAHHDISKYKNAKPLLVVRGRMPNYNEREEHQ